MTPTGTVIYDEWIDHDPADGGLALTRLRAAARRSPEAALRDALAGRADHAAARDVAEWLANEPVETLRPDEASLTGRTAPVAPEPRASAEPSMSGRSTNAQRMGGGLVARERLERRRAAAPADEALLAILVGANSTHTAGALLEVCGTVQQLAHESIGDSPRASTAMGRL